MVAGADLIVNAKACANCVIARGNLGLVRGIGSLLLLQLALAARNNHLEAALRRECGQLNPCRTVTQQVQVIGAPARVRRGLCLQALAQEEGVLVLQAGPDVVRLAPSLIIDEADMAEGMARLRAALRRMVG